MKDKLKEDSAFGPGMMFGIPGPGPKRDTKGIKSDPKKEKGININKKKMKNLQTYEDFLIEQTLQDRSTKDFEDSDWGHYLAHNKIERHLNANAKDIEELKDLPEFEEGQITTFSTKEKGNYVLNCGTANGKPACRLEDELNRVITFYVKK